MNRKEIIENNKLIAEFMGVADEPYCYIPEHKIRISDENGEYAETSSHFQYDELQYHSSWNWLMPVIKKYTDKMNDLQYDDELYICWENEILHSNYILSDILNNNIESIYNRVVRFIKRYNKNK